MHHKNYRLPLQRVFLSVLLVFLGACQRSAAHLETAPLSEWPEIRTVAILPVQNGTGRLVRLSFSPGVLSNAWDRVRRKAFVTDVEYEGGRTLLTQLEYQLAEHLSKKGYRVLDHENVRRRYEQLSADSKALSLEDLRSAIPADAYCYVLLNHWAGDDFAYEGSITAGHHVSLISAADGKMLWQETRGNREYRLAGSSADRDEAVRGRSAYFVARQSILLTLTADMIRALPSCPKFSSNPLSK